MRGAAGAVANTDGVGYVNAVTNDRRTFSVPLCYALLAALALVLFFPKLGSFGFWDPYEIKVADAARNVVTDQQSLAQATHVIGRPPATVVLVTAGFRLFGIGELGGRLPIAITSLFAVLACFYAGSSLIRRRGALLASFILATAPAFLLGARQLTTNAPLLLATSLTVGALARLCWPPEGSPPIMRVVDVLALVAGIFIGFTSGALLVGVVAPLAAVAVALLASPNRPRVEFAIGLGVAAVAGLGAAGWAWAHPTGYSALLGGIPHPFLNSAVFTNALKQLGFGLFPWIALLPIAGIHALAPTTSPPAASGSAASSSSAGSSRSISRRRSKPPPCRTSSCRPRPRCSSSSARTSMIFSPERKV